MKVVDVKAGVQADSMENFGVKALGRQSDWEQSVCKESAWKQSVEYNIISITEECYQEIYNPPSLV